MFIKIQQYSIFFKWSIEKIKKSGILNLKIVTNTKEGKGENTMLKFNEQKQIESVNGALALRNQINELIDGICKEG